MLLRTVWDGLKVPANLGTRLSPYSEVLTSPLLCGSWTHQVLSILAQVDKLATACMIE